MVEIDEKLKSVIENSSLFYLLVFNLFYRTYFPSLEGSQMLNIVNELKNCNENVNKDLSYVFLNLYKHKKIKEEYYKTNSTNIVDAYKNIIDFVVKSCTDFDIKS